MAKVLELNRKERVWVCSECQAEYKDIPAQCKCGAMAPVFNESADLVGKDEQRMVYLVERNLIYEGKQINKGTVISLVERDRVTKGMLKEKLITPVKEEKQKDK